MDNLEADLLTDLYNPKAPGFFSAYFTATTFRPAIPSAASRRVSRPMSPPEEVVGHQCRSGKRLRKASGTCRTSAGEIANHTANSDENNRTVQADHYKIETAIAKNDHFTAATVLDFMP